MATRSVHQACVLWLSVVGACVFARVCSDLGSKGGGPTYHPNRTRGDDTVTCQAKIITPHGPFGACRLPSPHSHFRAAVLDYE